jgi:hypothetical protein
MARSCGIHIGHRHAVMLVLDGSTKRPKVRANLIAVAPAHSSEPLEALSSSLKAAFKASKIKLGDASVGLAVDSGIAAFRQLTLPMGDRSKIEEVLKFEVESSLPHLDVDDVVIDFLVRKSSPVETDLLVTAVPKAELAERMRMLARLGLEPLETELEGTALFDAARHAGVLDEAGAQLLVHVGEHTTTLVAVEAGQLRSMRALHLDLAPPVVEGAEDPAASEGLSEPPAFGDAEGGEAAAEAGAETTPVAAETAADTAAIFAPDPGRLRLALERLTREVQRTTTASERDLPLTGVYICGLPLLEHMGSEIAGVPLLPLDPFGDDPGLSAQERSLYVVAFGAALHRSGGGQLKPHLRREELRYAGTFERLEVPLGVLGLLLLTFATAMYIVNASILQERRHDMSVWVEANMLYLLGRPEAGEPGRLVDPPESLRAYARRIDPRGAGDPDRTHFERLRYVERLVEDDIRRLQRELGTLQDIQPPMSALESASAVLDLIDRMQDQIGRFAIRDLRADYRAATGTTATDRVSVTLNLTFWAETDVIASRAYNTLVSEFEAQPWVIEVPRRPTTNLEQGTGLFVDGLQIQIDNNLIPKNGQGASL